MHPLGLHVSSWPPCILLASMYPLDLHVSSWPLCILLTSQQPLGGLHANYCHSSNLLASMHSTYRPPCNWCNVSASMHPTGLCETKSNLLASSCQIYSLFCHVWCGSANSLGQCTDGLGLTACCPPAALIFMAWGLYKEKSAGPTGIFAKNWAGTCTGGVFFMFKHYSSVPVLGI